MAGQYPQILWAQLDSGGSGSTTLKQTPKRGNMLVIATTIQGATEPTTPTDSKSNTYTKQVSVNGTEVGDWSTIFTTVLGAIGAGMVITHIASDTVIIMEVAFVDVFNPIDSFNSAHGGAGPATLGLTVQHDNCLVIGCLMDDGTTAAAAGSGLRTLLYEIDNISHERNYVEIGVFNASASPQTMTATLGSGAGGWAFTVLALRAPQPNSNNRINTGLRPHPFSPGLAR